MKQTTAERITGIIREHLKFYAGSGEWAAATEAGEQIAAEIDGLTAERDEAQRLIGIYSTSRDAVIAQLGEMNDALRAEVERLRPAAEAWEATKTVIDRLPFAERAGIYASIDSARVSAAARARAAKERKP